MSKNTKLWTAGTLKSRGWTEELIASLLPKPQRLYRNGRRVRAWRTDDIRRAEQSESFRSLRAASAENMESIPDDAALDAASQLLESAWDTAALPESREATLAARYHEAILRQIPAVGFAKRLRPGQSISYIEHFLHLETGTGAEPLGATLRRFVTAAPWLGANAASPLAGKLAARYAAVLLAISARDIASFTAAQPEANMDGLLEKGAFPVQELLQHPLSYLYSVFYIPRAIRSSLKLLVALNPKDEYPEARAMQRHFILHTGATNTGKTYAGFERLRKAKTGVYLAPLRLLALEAQERLLDLGVACSLTTGEEEDRREGDTHVAATAEKLDLSARYDVAVIDECQMIADRERGFAWTRAILGVLAPEVHLCAAPEARDLLIRIIESTGDTWEEIRHLRKTPLVCMRREIDFDDVKPGDALITFSKLGVLSVAEDLRAHGKEPAIIYGALPYSTRRRQMEGFLEGRMQYVVSTDAIGMGLNLPIRRVIFLDTRKFDGVERRDLKPAEIQQIAGRAGRFGLFDTGYVNAMGQESLDYIREQLTQEEEPIEKVSLGFPQILLDLDEPLDVIIKVWKSVEPTPPFEKVSVDEILSLYAQAERHRDDIYGFDDKRILYRMISCPIDIKDHQVVLQWLRYCKDYPADKRLKHPDKGAGSKLGLQKYETYYRKLDLYYQFSHRFDKIIDEDWLEQERSRTEGTIMRYLSKGKKSYIARCQRCGRMLPVGYPFKICDPCFHHSSSID